MTPTSGTDAEADSRAAAARRLRASVFASLATVFLLLLAIVAAGLWLRYEALLADGRRNAENLTHILSEHLSLQFDAIEAALFEVAAHGRLIGGPAAPGIEWLPVLTAARSGLHAVDSIAVADSRGLVTFSTRPETIGEPQAAKPFYRELSANPTSDALVADLPVVSPYERAMLLPVGRALRTVNGAFEGMAVATLVPARLKGFYDTVDVGPNGIVWLLHPAGRVLFRGPSVADQLDLAWPDIPVSAAGPDGERRGVTFGPIEAGGPDYLTAYRTADRTGLAVAVSLARRDLLAPWWKEVAAAAAFLAAAGLLIVAAGRRVIRALPNASPPPAGQ